MLIFTLGMLLIFIIVLMPGDDNSDFEEYCRNECWSRRNPCCYR